MKISKLKWCFAMVVFLASAPMALSQTPNENQAFSFSAATIDPDPPAADGADNSEEAIDYFTSTSYPSYFLGTRNGAFLYDTVKNIKIVINPGGDHYERAKPFLYPGDTFPGVIASVDNTLVWYQNPANQNGGDATQPWTKFVINPSSGCHDLYVVDLDGDGKQDVVCSGTANFGDASFVVFQNSATSWTAPFVNLAPAGDGVALVAINGVNGGARTNIVGCNNNNLYWYQNPGGMAARTMPWTPHLIGACNNGVALGSVSVGNRDIVIVGSSELEPTAWAPGLVYDDPGSNPFAQWTQNTIDSSYLDIHQITGDTLSGITYITIGEQEQASSVCNTSGLNDHPAIIGCRVAIFPWTGNGFGTPTIVSNLGTQNQQVLQINNVAWMVGANHDFYGAVDPAFHLWQFKVGQGAGTLSSGTYTIVLGANSVDGGFGFQGRTPAVQSYPVNSENSLQYWIWNGSSLQNVGFGRYLTDAGNGTVSEAIGGDPWAIGTVSGGYVLQDSRTGNYLSSSNSGTLAMSTTATAWQMVPRYPIYTITTGANAVDGGFGFQGRTPAVQLYPTTMGNTLQYWQWNGSTLQDVGYGLYMTDPGNGTVSEAAAGDPWTIATATVSGGGEGYILQNKRTGNYLSNNAGTLGLSSTPSVWEVSVPQ